MSLGDVIKDNGASGAMSLCFTLLRFLGKIVYDGTIIGRPLPPSVTESDLAVRIDEIVSAGKLLLYYRNHRRSLRLSASGWWWRDCGRGRS
jgi:hypothetical protein